MFFFFIFQVATLTTLAPTAPETPGKLSSIIYYASRITNLFVSGTTPTAGSGGISGGMFGVF